MSLDMIEMSEVDSLANNIAELTKAPMNLESIKSVILNQYTLSGKVYLRKKCVFLKYTSPF